MTTKKTLFIVTETEFSYNDEVYSAEGTGGIPLRAFNTKKDAEEFIAKQTTEWLKQSGSDNLCGYGYEISQIFSFPPKSLSKEQQDTFFDSGDTYTAVEMLNIEEASNEDLMKIAAALAFSPYTIHKVSIE